MSDVLEHPEAPAPPEHFAIYRKDYRPPEWQVPEVRLELELNPERTRVRSTLRVVRNGDHDRPLKLAGEKIVIAYNQVFDLPFTIVRPSALYGPRCVSRRVGQVFIENALEAKKLEIVGDGSEREKDLLHDDVVLQRFLGILEQRSGFFGGRARHRVRLEPSVS